MKPRIYLACIGHSGHGKSTLTAAILAHLGASGKAKAIEYKDLNKGGIDMGDGHLSTVLPTHIEYETESFIVHHVDCPGQSELIHNMCGGAAMADAVVLVVSAYDGPMPQTREHILICRQLGIQNVIVYMNKVEDCTDDMVDLSEMETRELMIQYRLPGATCTVIRGSAKQALQGKDKESIPALINAVDKQVPPRPTNPKAYPGMVAARVYERKGKTIACGIVRGVTIKKGGKVFVCNGGKATEATVLSIKRFESEIEEANDRDAVGIMLDTSVETGDLISATKPEPVNKLVAEMYFFREEEGGRRNPISTGYMPMMHFNTNAVQSKVILPKSIDAVRPGDNIKTVVSTQKQAIYIAPGDRFCLKDGGKIVAVGLVELAKLAKE